MRRPGGVIGAILLIWLVIGVIATWQRGYFSSGETNCAAAASIALTVVAGPLNYAGVNPQTECPQPSASDAALVLGAL